MEIVIAAAVIACLVIGLTIWIVILNQRIMNGRIASHIEWVGPEPEENLRITVRMWSFFSFFRPVILRQIAAQIELTQYPYFQMLASNALSDSPFTFIGITKQGQLIGIEEDGFLITVDPKNLVVTPYHLLRELAAMMIWAESDGPLLVKRAVEGLRDKRYVKPVGKDMVWEANSDNFYIKSIPFVDVEHCVWIFRAYKTPFRMWAWLPHQMEVASKEN